MVADDAYYLTPHEAALAVVATAMKKARLQIGTLGLNSVLGGVLFSAGSIMCVAAHAENPTLTRDNPGLADSFSGVLFGIGLFYVVIMGADLFNSNILFFSVGLLRRAVSVYDLLVSWSVSLIGNLAGSVFVSYLFCHVSAVTSSENWRTGSRLVVENKASFSFMETFLKGIAGNFFVCLAIYLQLMAKPLHVRLILIILPIFTFVSCGFTHVVADMVVSYIGMFNGADVSVGKYIWKLLIPAAIGNIIGGCAFSLVIPFYLHLVVVESDRKKLALPEYDARDEQPELNTDSRVVRISPLQEKEEEMENEEADEYESLGKRELDEINGTGEGSSSSSSSISPRRSQSSRESSLREYTPTDYVLPVSRTMTLRSVNSRRSARSLQHALSARSPPGVFPVRGMGEPLRREKTIENPYFTTHPVPTHELHEHDARNQNEFFGNRRPDWQRPHMAPSSSIDSNAIAPEDSRRPSNAYSVLEDRPGARLERVVTRLMENSHKAKTHNHLPRTTQDTFPHNRPGLSPSYSGAVGDLLSRHTSGKPDGLLRHTRSSMAASDASSIERSLKRAGITRNAAIAANAVAGVANFEKLDFSPSQSRNPSHATHPKPSRQHSQASMRDTLSTKANSVSLGILQTASDPSLQRST